MTSAKILNF